MSGLSSFKSLPKYPRMEKNRTIVDLTKGDIMLNKTNLFKFMRPILFIGVVIIADKGK